MQKTETPPTLDELGLMGDAEAILEDLEQSAQQMISEPEERWKKQSSLVTHNGVPLPERVRVWRTQNGHEAWLPTAMIRHHMGKRHEDGTPVFSRKPVDKKAIPIDQSCDICGAKNIKKVFYTQFDFEGHMDAFHPREWQSIQRSIERDERREERELLRALVGGAPKAEGVRCEDCDYVGPHAGALALHRRNKHGG